MKIPVLGMDPSLNHWGVAEAELDLITGELSTPRIIIIEPNVDKNKQVRVNSSDLSKAEQLITPLLGLVQKAKIVFVEIPVGSQTARAMTSYGVCIGILGALRATGTQLVEVTASETKKALAGSKTATKRQMIDAALEWYPNVNFTFRKGKAIDKMEHAADAIGSIHAGVNTQMFQSFMKLYQNN